MKHIAIYTRKSSESEDRQVLSLDSQIKELKAYATSRDWRVKDFLSESKSAKAPGRPIFGKLMESIQSGRIDAVLCWKLDRLARNPIDGGAIIWALEEKKLEAILTTQREFTNTGSDKFWLQLEFGIAKKYVDDLSDNVKRGLRTKLEQGWLPQIAPIGYLNDRINRTITKDPERFPIIRRMWELMVTGKYTVTEIHRRATEDWGLRNRVKDNSDGKEFALSAIYVLFRNPFYSGAIRYNGQHYDGAHTPMISRGQFDVVQRLLDDRHMAKPHRYRFTYSGLIRCGECGAAVTAEHKRNRYGYRYIYYHCTHHRRPFECRQKAVEEKQLESQLAVFTDSVFLPRSFLAWALEVQNEIEKDERSHDAADVAALKRKRKMLENQLSELLTLRLQKLIYDQEYEQRKQELSDRIAKLDDIVNPSEREAVSTKDRLSEIFNVSVNAPKSFTSAASERRRQLIRSVCSNLFLRDKQVLITAKKPFRHIQSAVKKAERQNAMFEPRLFRKLQPKKRASDPAFLIWWGLVKHVRTFLRENPYFKA